VQLKIAHHCHDVGLLARRRAADDDSCAHGAELCKLRLCGFVPEDVRERLAIYDELCWLASGPLGFRLLDELHRETLVRVQMGADFLVGKDGYGRKLGEDTTTSST
jgi:hypothetical protein